MDTLVSLGSTAAYLMSVVATFFPQVVGAITFYDTTALIVTLIYLGKYLEARATGQTNEALRKLIGLQPRTDRKSTRLNSSHTVISYAVFCLKKKKDEQNQPYHKS